MTIQSAHGAVGEILRSYRRAAGLTQESLAEQAGISPRSVQAIESGTNMPFPETLRRLSVALNLSETEREALAVAAQRPPRRSSEDAPRENATEQGATRSTTMAQPASMPQPLTPLLGREDEVALLVELLGGAETRLITLTGPGGVGKTRLALGVAARLAPTHADGVVFVDLTPLTDPGLALPTIAAALGVVAVGRQPLQTSLVRALGGKQRLLVLDNCEQVVEAAPEIAAVVAQCPALRVLATSRRPLRVRGERVVGLTPLPVPPADDTVHAATLGAYAAVGLFVQQAQTAHPGFVCSAENAAAVAAICRRLDGLPLALELAAARVGVLPPRALAERLAGTPRASGLSLLSGGARDLPRRHQSLRDTIAWSYALLSPPEQVLFCRLSVFSGGGTLEAVEQVCCEGDDGRATQEVLETLGALVENNLLRMVEQADGQPRYVLLETIREYGREQLSAASEAEAVIARHAAYYLALAAEARLHLHGTEQVAWLSWADREIDNLRAALRWCVERGRSGDHEATERGLWAVGCLLRYWMLRTHHREGRAWLAQLLALPAARAPTLARARALRVAGHLDARGVDPQGLALVEESIALCRALGDQRELAHSLFMYAALGMEWPGVAPSPPTAQRAALEEALALYEQTGYRGGIAGALVVHSQMDLRDGAVDRAEVNAARALALAQEVGDSWHASRAVGTLADVARTRGDLARARALLEQKQALEQPVGNWHFLWYTKVLQGEIAQEMGDTVTACACYEEAVRGFLEMGDTRFGVRALAGLALLAAEAGDFAHGLRLAATAHTAAGDTGVPPATQARLDEVRWRAERVLGLTAAEALGQAGATMTLEQTVAATLGRPAGTGRATT